MAGNDKRVLPSNKDAEQSVLAACMLNDEVAREVLPTLEKDDFHHLVHQSLFVAMRTLYEKGRGVDQITVADYLRAKGSKVPLHEILNIADNTYSLVSFRSHVEIVRRCALQRKIIRTCTELIGMAYDPQEDVESVRRQAAEAVMALIDVAPAQKVD